MAFYKNLYATKVNTHNQNDTNTFFERENERPIHDDELSACEGALTAKECLEDLREMGSEKTPGTDGLPAEFYKVFWKDISNTLISALNYAYEIGKLSISQRRGIIKLISKKDVEPFL